MPKTIEQRLEEAVKTYPSHKALAGAVKAIEHKSRRRAGWDRQAVQAIIDGFYGGSNEKFINAHVFKVLDMVE